MIIIIEGVNRTEFCRPKSKEDDTRRFFECRGQLYRAYPEQLTRMRIKKYGIDIGSDSVIAYQENSIHPMVEKGTPINRNKILADIDEHKGMNQNSMGTPKRAWAKLTSKHKNNLVAMAPLIVVGIVLLYAFLSNGGL